MKVNPVYVEALKALVKKSPYPSHMRMVLNHIESTRRKSSLIWQRAICSPTVSFMAGWWPRLSIRPRSGPDF